MTTTARLAMPLIQPGQAQKELYHNEALLVADAAVQASVAAVGLDAPPANPAAGACWIVGSAPTGAWAGRAQALAAFTATGWRFIVLQSLTPRKAGSIDLKAVLVFLKERRMISGAEYLASVEFGSEPVEGTGDVLVNAFRVDVR